jgi:hypothetical protein
VRMWATALHHTKIARELTMLRVAVSSAVELVVVRPPNEASGMDVTNELVAEFQKLEELCSRLKGHAARIGKLLLTQPPD